jgi:nicotinate-nucleotide adenylyltransferase
MKQGFPVAARGMVIGLLGGSFDPAHAGHAHLTRQAIKRFGLDRVWWLVSPGNPLKTRQPAPLAGRMARAQAVMDDPRVIVTDIEVLLRTRFTAATLKALIALYPGVRFVWLMGADNLVQIDQWDRWRDIMQMMPVGVLARPGSRGAARASRAAAIFRAARLPEGQARRLAFGPAPRWAFVNMPMRDESSTAIRTMGNWQDGCPLDISSH